MILKQEKQGGLLKKMALSKIKKVEKVWGSEEWIVNNDLYCGKILNLKRGYRGSIHYHEDKHETFYLLNGRVLIEFGEDLDERIMIQGDIQTLEPGMRHRFTPLEDSRIIEFSTHHEDEDTYRDSESGQIDVDKLLRELNG
jgi:mannose-6-phosphate isomerase-like protein (cupin superfamily)